MSLTTKPAFPQAANVGAMAALLSTAMTNTKAYDGTEAVGTAMTLVYTAGSEAINAVTALRVQLTSTAGATASGTTNATVVRFWINNGGANTTASNNQLLGELLIQATTIVALATSINAVYQYLGTIPNLPAGYRIYAGITVAVGGTNAALQVSAYGGNY